MPFPAIKLVGVFIKQLSKPLAGYVKRKAKENQFVRNYLCIPPAQWYHRLDVNMKMWTIGSIRSKTFQVKPLEESVAIDIGADMIGETFIFVVAAGVVGLEYWRSKVSAAKKEKKQDQSLLQLRKDVNQLSKLVEAQKSHIEELTAALQSLNGKEFNLVPADPVADRKRLR